MRLLKLCLANTWQRLSKTRVQIAVNNEVMMSLADSALQRGANSTVEIWAAALDRANITNALLVALDEEACDYYSSAFQRLVITVACWPNSPEVGCSLCLKLSDDRCLLTETGHVSDGKEAGRSQPP